MSLSILDASYELSRFVSNLYTNISKNENNESSLVDRISLQHDRRFCVKYSEGCATWTDKNECNGDEDDIIRLAQKTLFVVKTCKKYHHDRLPVIFKTWAKSTLNIRYFSDVAQKKYNTRTLPGIYQDTEIGLCQKTEEIIKYFHKNSKLEGWKWLVIVDDDTIVGVHNLLTLLRCYDPKQPLMIGHRYGYLETTGAYSYDYLGGGAGKVLSVGIVEEIWNNTHKPRCRCPRPEEHEDMYWTGVCPLSLGKNDVLLHNDRFHQNSPSDYPPELLEHRDPISFHKFWNVDFEYGTMNWNNPIKTYNTYFKDSDRFLREYKEEAASKTKVHQHEL